MRILRKQAPLTPIYQLYSTFNTLPIHLLHNQKILELVHCSMFHVCDLPEVYRNYFIVLQLILYLILLTNLCTVMIGKAMICIFIISRNQLAKELFSILEVLCGLSVPHAFKKCMFKNYLKVNLKCICFQNW